MAILENPSSRLKTTAIVVGVALAALTVGSYFLGIEHLFGYTRVAMAAVLLVAFVKVWLITQYFMDIRHAPRWLSAIVNGWTAVSGVVVIGLYIAL
jgi:heme/copper-type cytochrome/quinol oxidase subunit 4